MYFEIAEADDTKQEAIGEIKVDLQNPEKSYELDNGIRVQMDQYYPDYIIEDGEPATETKYPRNPAFVFRDRKSTRLNSSHVAISYAVFCLKKKRPASCKSLSG